MAQRLPTVKLNQICHIHHHKILKFYTDSHTDPLLFYRSPHQLDFRVYLEGIKYYTASFDCFYQNQNQANLLPSQFIIENQSDIKVLQTILVEYTFK